MTQLDENIEKRETGDVGYSGSRDLAVSYRPISELAPYERNARTHSKAQIAKIAESIRAFGFTNPVLTDRNQRIVAGHGRVAAAKLIGLDQVPTILLENLTPAQVRAYILADNRLAEDAGWDPKILKIELQNLVFHGQIDVSLTGFEVPEIDLLLLHGDQTKQDSGDEPPEVCSVVSTQPGDIWALGDHRILCGDVRDESALGVLMKKSPVAMVFTDPPYNVAIATFQAKAR